MAIEDVATLNQDFDLIVSTGVLHHLADPQQGMDALAACLRPDGVMAIMVYAKYGRQGVEMMQSVFRDLELSQDEQSLAIVNDALTRVSNRHPVKAYMNIAPDLQFDAGVVDTFLHGRDRSFTVDDVLELVSSAGLVFQDWLLKSSYYPPVMSDSSFHAMVCALPQQRQWSIMERIYSTNACHYFTACRPERRVDSYTITFEGDEFLRYVPSFRHSCGFDDTHAYRPGWKTPVDPFAKALLQGIDGQRTVAELIADASQSDFPRSSQSDITELSRKVFASFWQLDFLAMPIPSRG